MHSQSLLLSVCTDGAPRLIDITDDVSRIVAESSIHDGLVTVFTRDARTAVKINEHEPLLLEDLERMLSESGSEPAGSNGNGPVAGARPPLPARSQSLLGASETIPLVDGRLDFGRWQRLFLVELDQPSHREVVIQIVGT